AGTRILRICAGACRAHSLSDWLDGASRAAPAAGDLFHLLEQHVFILDGELPAHGVVVIGAGASQDGHVEAGEVATRGAAVTHGGNLRACQRTSRAVHAATFLASRSRRRASPARRMFWAALTSA